MSSGSPSLDIRDYFFLHLSKRAKLEFNCPALIHRVKILVLSFLLRPLTRTCTACAPSRVRRRRSVYSSKY